MKVETMQVPVDGNEIHVKILGDITDDTLIVLHGGPGFDSSYFKPESIWEEIADGRGVIFYDQRGCGKSSRITMESSCSFTDQISDFKEIITALNISSFSLLGHSFGAFLALAIATELGNKINKLIVSNPPSATFAQWISHLDAFYPIIAEQNKAIEGKVFSGDQEAIDVSSVLHMKMMFKSATIRDKFIDEIKTYNFRPGVLGKIYMDLPKVDLTEDLKKIKCPTLVQSSRHDANLPPINGKAISDLIPGSKFVIFEESGHYPFYEEAENFKKMVLNFLG